MVQISPENVNYSTLINIIMRIDADFYILLKNKT